MKLSEEQRDLALLTGADAGEMLRIALAQHGGKLRSWSVHAQHHRPGAGVSVGYSVIVDALPDAAAGAASSASPFRTDRYLVASTAKVNESRLQRTGGVTLTCGETRVHVWEHPNDPQLPALRLACDPNRLAAFLGEPVEVELLGYRPTRRAVIRIIGAQRNWYAKVVRPAQLTELETRLQLLQRSTVPAPQIIDRDERGFLVMSQVGGVPLSRLYADSRVGDERLMTALRSLDHTLDSLPLTARGLPQRPAWVDRCEHYAGAAAAVLPEAEQRCTKVAHGIRELLARADLGPIVPTHGDFYEANVYVELTSGAVQGLLDVDGLGPGYRVHDWACLLGHMAVLPGLAPQKYAHIPEILADWFTRLESRVDPIALSASTAGVVLSLVAGTRRHNRQGWQEQAFNRLAIAEEWVARGFNC
ncbi:MAG: phosphotransferase [Trueperella sp.]|nr:phosphotransferase [Trueperella sp.]